MSEQTTFYTFGYGRWPAATRAQKLVECLKKNKIEMLIDIRHSPCPSQLDPKNTYGPRPWHLQGAGKGIVSLLGDAGIGYYWAAEFGNPQKNDPHMTILREMLANTELDWPVHRGILGVRYQLMHHRSALMCACDKYEICHRKLIAEAIVSIIPRVEHHELES